MMVDVGGPVAKVIETIGVEQAARRYIDHLVNGGGAGAEDEVVEAYWSGDDLTGRLPTDLLWRMLLELVHQCPDDDELLWRVGDGPIDNNCIDPQIRRRLFLVRDTDAKVMRLFEAMRRQLPIKSGLPEGPWFD